MGDRKQGDSTAVAQRSTVVHEATVLVPSVLFAVGYYRRPITVRRERQHARNREQEQEARSLNSLTLKDKAVILDPTASVHDIMIGLRAMTRRPAVALGECR